MISKLGQTLVLVASLFLFLAACSRAEEPKRLDMEVGRVEFRDNIGPAVPSGVFAIVQLSLHNITDSPLVLNPSDFVLVDEEGKIHVESMEGLRAYASLYFGSVFRNYELDTGTTIEVVTIFDIPTTGLQRRLEIQFRHESPVEFDAIPER